MTTYQKIHKLLQADQKDRAFLKSKAYDAKFLASIRIRDYDRAEQICEIINQQPKLTKKALFESAVILHHSFYSLKFVKLGEKLAAESFRLGFVRAGKLLDFFKKDRKRIKKIFNSHTIISL